MIRRILLSIFMVFILFSCETSQKEEKSEQFLVPGVTHDLAKYRKQVLSNLVYQLEFRIPKDQEGSIDGKEKLSFTYRPKEHAEDLLMDFKTSSGKVKSIKLNNDSIDIQWEKEHIILPEEKLNPGENSVEIEFMAGNEALNRRKDFLYSLFVPDRARTAFPVFDQPDLKAVFNLKLAVPQKWKATANGTVKEISVIDSIKTIQFGATKKLPTYLFSFVSGRFKEAKTNWRGKKISLLYRETDSEKIASSIPVIFKDYKKYIRFYEKWTGIAYPFQKYGMVAIPDFQFGGMEHPGAILLQSSTLFLTENATQKEEDNRDQLLAHEIAHSWFGDMVTMKWFDDVWTKEVFANFMADKAMFSTRNVDTLQYNLNFIVTHTPSAYAVDRTLGANPIHQQLDNLEEAGTLYGNIIYDKAPIMMRQLEMLMGKDAFQEGIQDYLTTYRYDNATWKNLIEILDGKVPTDLIKWNKTWVNTPGRPVFSLKEESKNTKESREIVKLIQHPERGRNRIWPQQLQLLFFDSSGHKKDVVWIKDSLRVQDLSRLYSKASTDFYLLNGDGKGYGLMPVDSMSLPHLYKLKNPVNRASMYISLFENTINNTGKTPGELLRFYIRGTALEKEELNLGLLTRYIHTLYWVFLSEKERQSQVEEVEEQLWIAMKHHENLHNRKIIFESYEDLFLSDKAYNRLKRIWKDQQPPEGIRLSEADYTRLAFNLQLRKSDTTILNRQFRRIKNPDRQEQYRIVRPALSANQSERALFFKGLTKANHRKNESAVLMALSYLHHPLHHPKSEQYLEKTLMLLPEIQKTGDIFFPGRWLGVTFGNYRSPSAYKIVASFLKSHPKLSPKLKEKILQETDNLRRAQSL